VSFELNALSPQSNLENRHRNLENLEDELNALSPQSAPQSVLAIGVHPESETR